LKALTLKPGTPNSAQMVEVPAPAPAHGSLLVKGLAVGICGTDREIIDGEYGEAPPGEQFLVLGHKSLGEVVEAPAGSGFATGDLIVGIVRRPDPVPCAHCAIGEWDMCSNGLYRECGIKQQHGYASEEYRLDAQYAVAVDPGLGDFAVLLEPASVVAKACTHALHFLQHTQVPPRTALVTGAGPIGLLAALITTQSGLETYVVDLVEAGPKPDLVKGLGANYHAGSASNLDISPELVIECTGIGAVVRDAGIKAAPGAVIALTGISAAPGADIDLNLLNKAMVLSNKLMFGSVNAARAHYEVAAEVLARADPAWLGRVISRRVPLEHWPEALERQTDDVKVVLEISARKQS
jgi:glucose 1-dehydrogenase